MAWGVNDGGVIVGSYQIEPGFDGFAAIKGRYLSFQYPGAAATLPFGVNAAGEIVGSYTFDYQTYHGFVTSPIAAADFEISTDSN